MWSASLNRVAAALTRLSALALLASTFLPWYRAPSGRALCGRVFEPYTIDPMLGGECRLPDHQSVDLWLFKERAAIVLAIAAVALVVASFPPFTEGTQATRRPFRVTSYAAALTFAFGAVASIIAIISDQPGFGEEIFDWYYLRWGAWVALGCCSAIALGCLLALVARVIATRRAGP